MEPNKRLVALSNWRMSQTMRIESVFVGLPNLYPILKPGPNSFVSLRYCNMRHMPCRRRPGAVVPAPDQWQPLRFVPQAGVPFFDYYLLRGVHHHHAFRHLLSQVEHVHTAGQWALYRRKTSS